jgi:hypothetical protein
MHATRGPTGRTHRPTRTPACTSAASVLPAGHVWPLAWAAPLGRGMPIAARPQSGARPSAGPSTAVPAGGGGCRDEGRLVRDASRRRVARGRPPPPPGERVLDTRHSRRRVRVRRSKRPPKQQTTRTSVPAPSGPAARSGGTRPRRPGFRPRPDCTARQPHHKHTNTQSCQKC